MHTVYVFFFSTPFKTGNAIRLLTHNKYSHVAFSLEPNTKCLYSYARYRYSEPLIAGFGIETTDRYRQAPHPVDIKVCSHTVSDEHYARILRKIEYYKANQERTLYNFFDLLCYPFRHHHVELPYTHTCLSFVSELLEGSFGSINKLQQALSANTIFEGALSDFEDAPSVGEIDFFERRSRLKAVARSGAALACLTLALVHKVV